MSYYFEGTFIMMNCNFRLLFYNRQKHFKHVKWVHNFLAFSCFIFILSFLFTSQSFSQLATENSKFVGNTDPYTGNFSPTSNANNFAKYWNQVTPGNAGKWGSVQYNDTGSYNFSNLDQIYNYAISHGYPFKEHNLIWNTQQPTFMTDGSLDSVQEYRAIVNWIDTCGKRYPQTAFVDVVNEPISHAPSYMNALGGSGTTGWDWVIKAFELARQYWPNAKLLINEYNVINDANRNTIYLKIINLLKDRGLIDGIGVQAHSFEVDGPSVSILKTYLDKLTATGLPVYISEFSINESNDNTQLQKYQSIFTMLYEDPGVKGITIWGYQLYYMWSAEPNAYLLTDRLVERPALQWLRTYLTAYLRLVHVSPADSATVLRNPILTWNVVTGAKYYHIQVASDTAFKSLAVDTTVADTSWQLDTLKANSKYYWHVFAFNPGDTGRYSSTALFITGDQITGIEKYSSIPRNFSLMQNYPNPFNPSTVIRYSIPQSGMVKLTVYNLLGQRIATLVNKIEEEGSYEINFNASGLSSGIYLYMFEAFNVSGSKFTQVKKMMLLK